MPQLATESLADHDTPLAKLFPLPLSTVEHFMFLDGRSNYPMLCDVQVELKGTIERGPFGEALAFAMQRAPFFRSVIEEDKKRGLLWRLTDRMPTVDWDEYGIPCTEGYDQFIDLRTDPGLRVFVRSGGERSSILLHFHHATADGVGSMVFVEDLLTAYHNATPGTKTVRPRRLEPERLLKRCTSNLENPGVVRGLYDVFCGVRGAYEFFSERPLPLHAAKPALPADATRRQNGFIRQSCSRETTGALRKLTSQRKVTLNDVFLRDLYLTLHAAIEADGTPVGRRHLRVLMPQSLRGRGDAAMPTTNDLGFAFIGSRGSLCERPAELLDNLKVITAAIRKDNLSRHFIGGLAAVESLGLLPRLLRGQSCFATAVLTNFGNAWRRFEAKLPLADGGLAAGNLVYDCLIGTPPIRPNTAAAFCVTTTMDEIVVCLKHDPFYYPRAESVALLDRYIRQIEKSAQSI
ncbi:MAG: wax ester/triacylglycerol synthase domain-containing protein [Pirellulaceae bacterium]